MSGHRCTLPARRINRPKTSRRLIAAAQGAVIEGVQDAAGKAVETGKGALKGALDLLLPAK